MTVIITGPRISRKCTHKECVPAWRHFGNPSWNCPDHGPSFTVTEANRPYFGQPTPQAPKERAKGAPA